jgi:hypothetical protein
VGQQHDLAGLGELDEARAHRRLLLEHVEPGDETALARLIEVGDIAGAGLDVFEQEPAVSPRLVSITSPRAVLTTTASGLSSFRRRAESRW